MSEQTGVNAEVERPPEAGVQRGRPGRRTAEDRTAAVTAERYPVATVVCVQGKDMAGPWCLAASDPAASAATLIGCYVRTLLGMAGESLGYDRMLKASTVKRRTPSLLRQGVMLYELIPMMPEERLRPRVQRFGEMLLGQRTFAEVFGLA